jgi:hypothetical protein
MLDAKTVLDVLEDALEKDPQAIKSHLGSQWTEFSRRVGNLAAQFKAVASEDDPEVAACGLEVAVNNLLRVCWDYEYIAELFDQAEEAAIMRPRPPAAPPPPGEIEFREIANRYYDLLAKLTETIDQLKEDASDH